MFDVNYAGYRQSITYSVKKLKLGSIIIDGSSKFQIKRTLNSLGINEGTVYPDLKHISDSIIENQHY